MQQATVQARPKRPQLLSSGMALIIFLFLYFAVSLLFSCVFLADNSVKHSFSFNIISIIISQLICMLFPVLIVCYANKFDFLSVMRLRKGLDIWQILLLIVMSVGVLLFANGLNNIFVSSLEEFVGYVPSNNNFYINGIPQLVFSALIVGLLPAFCEEFFFRGLVLRSFQGSRVVAILLSAFLFGVMHGNMQQVLFAFIVGCLLAVVVECSDSLLPSMILHFLNNAIAMVITYFQHENEAVNFTYDIIVTASALWVSVGAIVIAGTLIPFIFYTRRRNQIKYGQTMPNQYNAECPIVKTEKRPVLAWVLIAVFVSVQCGYMAMDLLFGG